MHLADIVPTRSHMRGPWNQAYDLDALRTMEQKADYLARAVAGGWWVSFAHDDRVFAAQVRNDRGRLVLGESIPMPSLERESRRRFSEFERAMRFLRATIASWRVTADNIIVVDNWPH